MMRVIVNLTWRCDLACAYCWVRALGWHRVSPEAPIRRWLWWLRQLEPGSGIDFSGGEPLLYAGLVPLLSDLPVDNVRWAMTSNLANERALRALLETHPAGCVQINTSWHAQSPPDFWERVAAVWKWYPVTVNVVDHPSAPTVPAGLSGINVAHVPYQPFYEGEGIDGLMRQCNAGEHHLACGPGGDVYRCLVAMQKGEPALGTIATAPDALRTQGMQACEGGCTTCYTDMPAAWSVTMKGAT